MYKVLFVSIWDKEKVLLNRTSWQYPLLHYLGTSVTSHMIFSDNFETPDVLIMSYHLSNEYNYLISHFMLMFIVALMQIKKKVANSTTMDFFDAFFFLCRFHERFLSIIRLMPYPSTLYTSQNVFCWLRIFWARPKFELLQNIFCLLKNWIY